MMITMMPNGKEKSRRRFLHSIGEKERGYVDQYD